MLNPELGEPIDVDERPTIVTRLGAAGHAIYGPYESLPAGDYFVDFFVSLRSPKPFFASRTCAVLDIVCRQGKDVLTTVNLSWNMISPTRTRFRVLFCAGKPGRYEYRLWTSGKAILHAERTARAYRVLGDGRDEWDTEFPRPTNGTPSALIEQEAELRALSRRGMRVNVQNDSVVVTSGKISFLVQEDDDLKLVGEVVHDDVYRFSTLGDVCVVDVGTNIGLASLLFASQENVVEVHTFEPFADTYDRAAANFALNPRIAGKIHQYSVGLSNSDWEGAVALDGGGDTGARSVVAGGADQAPECVASAPVVLRDAAPTLEPILVDAKRRGLRTVVKIDCEGSEFDIFESLAAASMFHWIDILMVEWHAMFEDRTKEDLTGVLKKSGFVIFDRSPPSGNGFFYAAKMAAGEAWAQPG
ncbi:FkbM family methyltransferase [Sphingomonas sp.]|uniref:FkbM family methyltransferase n=1 Tax=Sphingomonas sp. TaxID=28214 RepID=UPI003B00AB73